MVNQECPVGPFSLGVRGSDDQVFPSVAVEIQGSTGLSLHASFQGLLNKNGRIKVALVPKTIRIIIVGISSRPKQSGCRHYQPDYSSPSS